MEEAENLSTSDQLESDQKLDLAGKYLTFSLDKEEYGLRILRVREIIGMLEVTPVPQTAPFVKGVINLRGKVIPVIDLRLRFGLEYREPDERTCIIVVEIEGEGQMLLISIVVDQVNEVINVQPEDIDPAPSFGTDLDTAYILGIAKVEGSVKILLDIDQVVGDTQLVM
ncbi:MAG: chemotaxis protein CheW [Desulfarculaceae bacterium]|jgi:purine-binding chemotaxis protein CheW